LKVKAAIFSGLVTSKNDPGKVMVYCATQKYSNYRFVIVCEPQANSSLKNAAAGLLEWPASASNRFWSSNFTVIGFMEIA